MCDFKLKFDVNSQHLFFEKKVWSFSHEKCIKFSISALQCCHVTTGDQIQASQKDL